MYLIKISLVTVLSGIDLKLKLTGVESKYSHLSRIPNASKKKSLKMYKFSPKKLHFLLLDNQLKRINE